MREMAFYDELDSVVEVVRRLGFLAEHAARLHPLSMNLSMKSTACRRRAARCSARRRPGARGAGSAGGVFGGGRRNRREPIGGGSRRGRGVRRGARQALEPGLSLRDDVGEPGRDGRRITLRQQVSPRARRRRLRALSGLRLTAHGVEEGHEILPQDGANVCPGWKSSAHIVAKVLLEVRHSVIEDLREIQTSLPDWVFLKNPSLRDTTLRNPQIKISSLGGVTWRDVEAASRNFFL